MTVLNVYNIAGYNRGPASYDVTHTLSSSLIYELPFGRTSWWGGWQTSGILYFRTGLPVQHRADPGRPVDGNRKPAEHGRGSERSSDPTVEKWFDPAAYQPPADTTGTFGDTGRNTVRGPGQFNIDMSIIKNTHFGRSTWSCAARRSTSSTTRSSSCRTGRSGTPPSARSPRCCRTRPAPSAARRSVRSSSRRSCRSECAGSDPDRASTLLDGVDARSGSDPESFLRLRPEPSSTAGTPSCSGRVGLHDPPAAAGDRDAGDQLRPEAHLLVAGRGLEAVQRVLVDRVPLGPLVEAHPVA